MRDLINGCYVEVHDGNATGASLQHATLSDGTLQIRRSSFFSRDDATRMPVLTHGGMYGGMYGGITYECGYKRT